MSRQHTLQSCESGAHEGIREGKVNRKGREADSPGLTGMQQNCETFKCGTNWGIVIGQKRLNGVEEGQRAQCSKLG